MKSFCFVRFRFCRLPLIADPYISGFKNGRFFSKQKQKLDVQNETTPTPTPTRRDVTPNRRRPTFRKNKHQRRQLVNFFSQKILVGAADSLTRGGGGSKPARCLVHHDKLGRFFGQDPCDCFVCFWQSHLSQ